MSVITRRILGLAAAFAGCVGAVVCGGCGGKVFVDGGGGSATTTSTSPSGGCESTVLDLIQKSDVAQGCDPSIGEPQCDGSAMVHNGCGCPVVANENNPERVNAAEAAWDAVMASNCSLEECFTCPPPPPWFCDPASMRCRP